MAITRPRESERVELSFRQELFYLSTSARRGSPPHERRRQGMRTEGAVDRITAYLGSGDIALVPGFMPGHAVSARAEHLLALMAMKETLTHLRKEIKTKVLRGAMENRDGKKLLKATQRVSESIDRKALRVMAPYRGEDEPDQAIE